MPKSHHRSALHAFDGLTVEGVRADIQELLAEVASIQGDIEALQHLAKLLEIRERNKPEDDAGQSLAAMVDRERSGSDRGIVVNGPASAPPEQPREGPQDAPRSVGRQPSPETVRIRKRLADALRGRQEPVKIGDLTRMIGEQYGVIANAIKCSQFEKTEKGYRLA